MELIGGWRTRWSEGFLFIYFILFTFCSNLQRYSDIRQKKISLSHLIISRRNLFYVSAIFSRSRPPKSYVNY